MNTLTTENLLRFRLSKLLAEYKAHWPEENSTAQDFLDFVESDEVLQGKENTKRHITASTWILNQSSTKALLCHHRKLNIWVQLGGHTDPDEDWVDAALREAYEESGLRSLRLASPSLYDLDIHEIPQRPTEAAHLHYDIRFLVYADENEPLVVSEESTALAWVPLDKISDWTTERSQIRMVKKSPPSLVHLYN